MKNGTMYAGRLKSAYHRLRDVLPDPTIPEPDDPLRRLAIAILGVSGSDEEAARSLDRAMSQMVDWNELRVSSPFEIHQAIGDAVPHGLQRCQQLVAALLAIYMREHSVSLARLSSLGRREARQYLEKLNGVDEYAAASVVLWSLGGHAIPVNDRLLTALREAQLIHPDASRAEVQAFLERNISATEAKRFCLVMKSFPAARRREAGREKSRSAKERRTASK
jgi:endonuclease III